MNETNTSNIVSDTDLVSKVEEKEHSPHEIYHRDLFDLLSDVSLALVDSDEMLHDRVQAFMDRDPRCTHA